MPQIPLTIGNGLDSGSQHLGRLSRRQIFLAGIGLFWSAATAQASAPDQVRAVELTFLKATPGNRENLKKFIERNWFAMDRIAKDEGLMAAYTVLDAGNDDGPWDLLVSVTYRDEKGYAGIVEPFERIRAAHRTVRVDGKGFKELGTIVQSRQLFEARPEGGR